MEQQEKSRQAPGEHVSSTEARYSFRYSFRYSWLDSAEEVGKNNNCGGHPQEDGESSPSGITVISGNIWEIISYLGNYFISGNI